MFNKWSQKPKNYDFNYDYTEHVISEGNLNQTLQKVSNFLTIIQTSTIKNLDQSMNSKHSKTATKPKNGPKFAKDNLYEFFYKKTLKPIVEEVQNSQPVQNDFIQQNGMLQLDENMEFGSALGVLHNHLFSIELGDD